MDNLVRSGVWTGVLQNFHLVVLVTGATGYLASCLVKQLAEAGSYRLRCTVRSLENNQKLESLKQVLKNCKTQPEFVKADLLQSADQWKEIVNRCDYVLHTASPFPLAEVSDPDLIIKPAVEGTLSVLKACADAEAVKGVVLTSSCASIFDSISAKPGKVFTEADWPDVSKIQSAYSKSKPLAEKAAWDYVNGLPEEKKFNLAVLNPGLIIGPPVMKISSTSIDIGKNIMTRAWPMVPPVSLPLIDVRDVALAHILAMKIPGASGHRHILTNGTYWMKDMANMLADEFNPKGFNISRRQAPSILITIQSIWDASARAMRQEMGNFYQTDNTRMRTVLQIEPRPIRQSLIEMGDALIELGIVPRAVPKQ